MKQWWHSLDRGGAIVMLILLIILLASLSWLKWGDEAWKRELPQQFLDDGKLDTRRGIMLGLWASAVSNSIIAMLLLATSAWWARQKNNIPLPSRTKPSAWVNRLFWAGLITALLAAVWIRAPRLNHGFWNDEELAFRKFVWGENTVNDSGQLEFKAVPWKYTFFTTISGNNHVTQSVQSRAVHEIWKSLFYQEGDPPFREGVIRFSPFLNGILGIAALALLIRICGHPLAGVSAAWVLTLNPWHLRYSVEARGYADLLLFICLTFICLVLALRSGRWRWWLGYGIFQSLYLLSFAGAVYLAMAQNLVVLTVLVKRRESVHLWRWFVCTSVGAMLFLQIMFSMAIKIFNYMKTHTEANFPITIDRMKDFWSHLVFGSQWESQTDTALHHGISIEAYQAAHPIVFWLMALIIPLLLAIGFYRLVKTGSELTMFVSAMLGAIFLIGLHNALSEMTFYIWYAVYLVLAFAALLALAPEGIAQGCSSIIRKWRDLPLEKSSPLFALVIILVYGWMASPSIARLREYEREPMKGAVKVVRGESPALDPANEAILTYAIGSGSLQMRTYDPWMQAVRKDQDFKEMLAQAQKAKKPLFVYACSPTRVKREYPLSWNKLENPDLFEKVTYLKGLEEFWSFQIYRLIQP